MNVKVENREGIYALSACRTLHEFRGFAYYNCEGTHYRVFESFEDGLKWLDNRDSTLIIAEFSDENELDDFFFKYTEGKEPSKN